MSYSAHSKAKGLAWPPAQCGAQHPGQPPRLYPSLHACPQMLPCWPNSALSYPGELHCRQNLAQGSGRGVTEGRRGHWCQSTCLTWGSREGKFAFLEASKGKKLQFINFWVCICIPSIFALCYDHAVCSLIFY